MPPQLNLRERCMCLPRRSRHAPRSTHLMRRLMSVFVIWAFFLPNGFSAPLSLTCPSLPSSGLIRPLNSARLCLQVWIPHRLMCRIVNRIGWGMRLSPRALQKAHEYQSTNVMDTACISGFCGPFQHLRLRRHSATQAQTSLLASCLIISRGVPLGLPRIVSWIQSR